jgi:hypothetical protein
MSHEPVRPTGRRLRYGLRSLLVLIAIAAVAVGFVQRRAANLRIQRSVAAEIQRLGGYVRFEVTDPGPAWLMRLLGTDFFADVYLVECDSPQLGDDTLLHIEKLHRLEWLLLDSDQISDAGVRRIANLTALGRLDLGSQQITDDGIAALQRLSNLRWLALRRTQVTPAGVERLRQALPNCQIQWERPSFRGTPSAFPEIPPLDAGPELAQNRLFDPNWLR